LMRFRQGGFISLQNEHEEQMEVPRIKEYY